MYLKKFSFTSKIISKLGNTINKNENNKDNTRKKVYCNLYIFRQATTIKIKIFNIKLYFINKNLNNIMN